MEINDRIIRTKIQLQKENPFFSYLALYLKFKEDAEKKLPEGAGCGVNQKGDLIYKKEFFEDMNDDKMKGVIAHEILHLALLHLFRRGSRDKKLWNVATDICTNSLLLEEGFSLYEKGILPDYQHKITIGEVVIENCNKKTAEEVYNELDAKLPKDSPARSENSGFDEHIEGNDGGEGEGEGEKESEEGKEQRAKDWSDKVSEAYVSSQMVGKNSAGIDRLFGKLHESKINWKEMLRRFILSYIPFDYSYAKPNKKSVSAGFYMPDYIKEKIEVAIAIDVSGSIGQKEIEEFLSEIIGMAKAYKDKIKMTLYTHDTEVTNKFVIENGNIDKIKKLNIRGGGGTSHIKVMETIGKEQRDCKVAVFLTDFYSDIEQIDLKKYGYAKIFLISKNGKKDIQIKNAKVVYLK